MDDLRRLIADEANEAPVYSIGGGTMLATRWGHRKSTDIDLVVPDGTGLEKAARKNGSAIREALIEAGAKRILLTDDIFMFEFKDGKIDLAEKDLRPPDEEQERTCDGMTLKAMSNTQILRGKLERSLKQEPPARDVFDIIVARRLDGAAVEKACGMIGTHQRHTIVRTWQAAEHRVSKEAEHELIGVAPEWKRFTRNLGSRGTREITATMEAVKRSIAGNPARG